MKQFKDSGIVLSRINYGERDRILTLLCREKGKISVLAKSVRAEKSKLAGGIELLSESEVSFVQGKSDLFALTSARLVQHFGNLVGDMNRMNQAFKQLQLISKIIQTGSGQEYYPILLTSLKTLNELDFDSFRVQLWFDIHILRLSGHAPNLHTDTENQSLKPGAVFRFDYDKQCFFEDPQGIFTDNHIKLLRLYERSNKPLDLEINQEILEQDNTLMHNLVKTTFM